MPISRKLVFHAHVALVAGIGLASCEKQKSENGAGEGPHATEGPSATPHQPEPVGMPEQLRDEDVTRAVQEELANDPGVDANAITVRTKDGIVELTGKVPDLSTQERADDNRKPRQGRPLRQRSLGAQRRGEAGRGHPTGRHKTGTVDSWSEYHAATENALEGGAIAVYNELKVE